MNNYVLLVVYNIDYIPICRNLEEHIGYIVFSFPSGSVILCLRNMLRTLLHVVLIFSLQASCQNASCKTEDEHT